MKKRAFTLIELLVVIAIIALLLSIIMPSLQKVKEMAKRVLDGNNARQIGLGLKVYTEENDNKIIPLTNVKGKESDNPQPHHGVVAFNDEYRENGEMVPLHLGVLYRLGYIENPEIFYCPAQPVTPNYDIPYHYDAYTNDGRDEWGTVTYEVSWSANYCRTSYNYWTYNETRLSDLGAYKPLAIDNVQEWEVIPHRKGTSKSDTAPQGLTALFADGHVAFCTDAALWTEYTWNGANSADGVNANGPGNDLVAFERILKVLEGN